MYKYIILLSASLVSAWFGYKSTGFTSGFLYSVSVVLLIAIVARYALRKLDNYSVFESDIGEDLAICLPNDEYGQALEMAYHEILRAKKKHGPKNFNSNHEGFAVLAEEVDEAWDEIKADNTDKAKTEMVQVAAMAIRFVAER